MQKVLKNKYIILTILFLCGLMFYFIGQKQGFHEDEIFSYGSSNYKYDNVYRWYGYAQADQDVIYNQVLKGSLKDKLNNVSKYLKNPDSFEKDEILAKETPIFRSKDDALEYLTINKNDIFNYFSVYYNQAMDVHPPLFYFLVHFVSSLFYGSFSKYIIFSLNLVFFIGTLIVINKIMKKLGQDKLGIPTMILYGASIGCISTVMFQRMYMMLTFFSILYLYLTIKFIKDDFNINNKLLWIITILFGFLTQYYFCVYIVLLFIIMSLYLLINKQYKKWFNYLKVHVIAAVIGVVFYPFSIEDIFFSYRGIGSTDGHTKTFIESFVYYFGQIYKLFGLNSLLIILVVLLIITLVYKVIKKDFPKFDKQSILNIIILIIPTLVYIMIISKIAPFLGENYTSRYIMLLFPIIAISIFYLLSFVFNKKLFIIALVISLLLSINGLINNTPVYLYNDYGKVMDLANDNKDKYFVYVFDNYFTHLSSLPEFATYKESIILNHNIHDFNILDNEELNNSDEFILCIKNWLNQEEILNRVLEGSKYKNYEKILEFNSDVEATYYKVTR